MHKSTRRNFLKWSGALGMAAIMPQQALQSLSGACATFSFYLRFDKWPVYGMVNWCLDKSASPTISLAFELTHTGQAQTDPAAFAYLQQRLTSQSPITVGWAYEPFWTLHLVRFSVLSSVRFDRYPLRCDDRLTLRGLGVAEDTSLVINQQGAG